jgi:hypothetical protein
MIHPTTRTPDDLREAFYELSVAQPIPDAETLDAFIKLYPQHAEALTTFAIELTIDALVHCEDVSFEADENDIVSPAVARAMSAYHNRMYELQRKKSDKVAGRTATEIVENPFLNLDKVAIRGLAQGIGVNPTFISKLRDRMIEVSTISRSFQEIVARELKVPLQLLAVHLSAQSVVQAPGQHYKADQKPVLGMKQSFEAAVRSSGLTDEQQRNLLSL